MAVLVISYSRVDQPQVRALVSLLTASLHDVEKAVFWDEQFEPGEPWFEQLKSHIDAAPQLFVFWCDHANTSEQVRREFTYALERNKRVVPVLLDDTPLAAELAPIHGIDLRGAIRHGRLANRPLILKVGAWVAAVLVAALVYGATFSRRLSPADRPTSLVPPAEVVLDDAAAGSPIALSDQSRARVDAFLSTNRSNPGDAIRIEVHSTSAADAAAQRLTRYLVERHRVPPALISVTTRDGTADDPLNNRIVLRVNPAPLALPSPPASPWPFALVVLAIVTAVAALIFSAVRRRNRETFIVKEFARHVTPALPG
jgi:hypothetical protein